MIFLLITIAVLISCQKSFCETKERPVLLETEVDNEILVSESVALLIRPILDEQYKRLFTGEYEYERNMSNLLYSLIENESAAADEALVALSFFYIGESQEDSNAIISRGTRMLIYLEKYRNKNPIIPDRNYPNSMRRNNYGLEGRVQAIKQGLRGTWDSL